MQHSQTSLCHNVHRIDNVVAGQQTTDDRDRLQLLHNLELQWAFQKDNAVLWDKFNPILHEPRREQGLPLLQASAFKCDITWGLTMCPPIYVRKSANLLEKLFMDRSYEFGNKVTYTKSRVFITMESVEHLPHITFDVELTRYTNKNRRLDCYVGVTLLNADDLHKAMITQGISTNAKYPDYITPYISCTTVPNAYSHKEVYNRQTYVFRDSRKIDNLN